MKIFFVINHTPLFDSKQVIWTEKHVVLINFANIPFLNAIRSDTYYLHAHAQFLWLSCCYLQQNIYEHAQCQKFENKHQLRKLPEIFAFCKKFVLFWHRWKKSERNKKKTHTNTNGKILSKKRHLKIWMKWAR